MKNQSVFWIKKHDVMAALDDAAMKYTNSYAFGESSPEEVRIVLDTLFDNEDQAVKVSVVNNMIKGLETVKMIGGANAALDWMIKLNNESKQK